MGRQSVKLCRPPLLATLLTIAAVLVLCALGAWQVQRLHWKRGLLADIIAARAAGPQDVADIGAAQAPLYARLQGHYADARFLIGPRTYEGVAGYHIVVPLLTDRGAVLVNRGWVPEGQQENIQPPRGDVDITGMLRTPGHGNVFTPPNVPEKNQWFRFDLLQMAAAANLDLAPLVMYAESETPEAASLQPVRAALVWSPPNNHLQYAVFWFTMAAALCVIFALRFLRR
jgi:surfeit locus 1 family protein